ncbi:TRAP transporter large permease subunit [Ornithinimicrobium faecis]|uniref:TRAP transporter large permease subunit n=1 Tax=Ornithinimicrobium faecis TaxID=2934158 RepID=UPI00211938B8|nr:TRAP transporter large permease subunit [Ornithinimicrobium sp. HY1745]
MTDTTMNSETEGKATDPDWAELPREDQVEQVNPLVKYSAYAAGALVLLIAIAVTYEVILRLVAGHGTSWVYEYSTYTLLWFTMLAGGYVLAVRRHIHVDVIVDRLSAKTQALAQLAGSLMVLAYIALLTYFTFEMLVRAAETGQRSPTPIQVPFTLILGIMFIGLAVFTFQAVMTLWQDLKAFRSEKGKLSYPAIAIFVAAVTASIVMWPSAPEVAVLLLLFTLLFAGLPIFSVLGVVGTLGLTFIHGTITGLEATAEISRDAVTSNTLLAIPLFILAGIILQRGGLGRDLYMVAATLLGGMRGSLGIATIAACAIFASISGSSVATAGAIGLIAIPEMMRRGYKQKKVTGMLAAGGTLGILIPPSTAMIIYAGMTNESTGQLFIAGIIPGALLVLLFSLYVYFTTDRSSTHQVKYTSRERWEALRRGLPGLSMPAIVMFGIYFGLFTATEAASIALVYAAFLTFVQGRLTVRDIPSVVRDGTIASGMIAMIIVGAHLLGALITLLRIPNDLIAFVEANNFPVIGVMLGIVACYIVLGMFLEVVAVMLITLPIVYPLVISMGIDGLWFGIFVVILMELCLITPPVGLNLFVIKDIANAPLGTVIRGAAPYFFLLMFGALVIAIFPWLVTWLPSQIY